MLRAAEERGLRVPEDVTVVGYDNPVIGAIQLRAYPVQVLLTTQVSVIYATTINRVSLTTVDQWPLDRSG